MDRNEFICRLVLGDIAGGYKNVDQTTLSLPAPAPSFCHGMPPIDKVEDDFKTWFYITPKGPEFLTSNDTWPFDDDGNLRPGWRLDAPQT